MMYYIYLDDSIITARLTLEARFGEFLGEIDVKNETYFQNIINILQNCADATINQFCNKLAKNIKTANSDMN